MPGPTGRPLAGTELEGCRPGLPPSQSLRELVILALARGRWSGNSHHPLRHLLQGLDLATQGFQRFAPLTVSPLLQLPCNRPLEAVDLGFQSGAPRDLPLPPVLQAYFILNTSGKKGPWVGTWSAPWSRCRCGLVDGAGQLLKALVDCLLVDTTGFPRSLCSRQAWNAAQSIRMKSGRSGYFVKE
jgi:hypothetical protein